jgi:hypothetical protein
MWARSEAFYSIYILFHKQLCVEKLARTSYQLMRITAFNVVFLNKK